MGRPKGVVNSHRALASFARSYREVSGHGPADRHLLLLSFAFNFWYLQGVNGEEYASLAENNRMRRIPLPPTRGVIFDRNEEVIAATRPSLDLVLRRENPVDLDLSFGRRGPQLVRTASDPRLVRLAVSGVARRRPDRPLHHATRAGSDRP